jgi:N-methylhydantoinase A
MHVGAYGEQLGVSKVVIPYSASVHGAFGLVTSDIAHEDQITRPLRAPFDLEAIRESYGELEERIVRQLEAEGFERGQTQLHRAVDMRYRRQVHIVTAPFVGDDVDEGSVERTIELFERLYEEKYGPQSAYREAGIELVSFRLRGVGVVSKQELHVEELGDEDSSAALVERVEAWVDEAGELQEVPGYDFERLRPGNAVPGPAIVWTPITTVVVGDGQSVEVDEYKNLVIHTSVG